MEPTDTGAITEFAIVVAGFTGLVLAIGSRDGVANPVVKFRTVTMLFFTFTAAFGSLLPLVAQGLEVNDVWVASSYGLVLLLFANIALTFASSRILLTPDHRRQLQAWMWTLVVAGNSLFGLLLVSALVGLVALPLAGVFVAALIWQLVLSAILFTRLILQG